jgi:hypothetical protein
MSSLVVTNATKFGGNIDLSSNSMLNVSAMFFGPAMSSDYGRITISSTTNIVITSSGVDIPSTSSTVAGSSTRNVYVFGNLLPGLTDAYNLGGSYSSGIRWKGAFASNTTIATTTLTFEGDTNVFLSAEQAGIQVNSSGLTGSGIPGAMANQNFIFACGADTNLNILASSPDGKIWCNVLTPSGDLGSMHALAFDGNATWVAVGGYASHGSIVSVAGAFSDGGWKAVSDYIPVAADYGYNSDVCFCKKDNRWYSVANATIQDVRSIIRSGENDEQIWESAVNISGGSQYFKGLSGERSVGVGFNVTWDGNDTIVATGLYGNINQNAESVAPNSEILWYSPSKNDKIWYNATLEDGVTLVNSGFAQGGVAVVAFNGVQWAAAGASGVLVSPDGRKWKQTLSGSFYGIQWNGQFWLVVGGFGPTYYSSDGLLWTPGASVGGYSPYAVGWNGTYWFIGGYDMRDKDDAYATLMYSSNVAGPWTASQMYSGTDPNNPTKQPILDTGVEGFANRTLLPNSPLSTNPYYHKQEGVPSLNVGRIGDYYIDACTGWVYGPKTANYSFGDGGSVYLSNTTFISTVSASDVFNIALSEFTVNFFMYPTSLPNIVQSNPAQCFLLDNDISTGTGAIGVNISADSNVYLQFDMSYYDTGYTVSTNEWQYCTLLRNSGGNVQFYVGGSMKLTTNAVSPQIGNNVNPLVIGSNYTGLFTNVRWTKGVADVPTGAPTSPLSTLSDTNLLLLTTSGGSVLKDSANVFTNIVGVNTVFMGTTPFNGSVTLSWGAPVKPVSESRLFTGYGVPLTDPSGSTPGDFYKDLSSGIVYSIVAS